MNVDKKTPIWQKSPGVFFVFNGSHSQLQDFLEYQKIQSILQIHVEVGHTSSDWFDTKFFRVRESGILKFPFSHQSNLMNILAPKNPLLEQQRNFLFNLDLLKEDFKEYVILIPHHLQDELAFVGEHLKRRIDGNLGPVLKLKDFSDQEVSLYEWNEYIWRKKLSHFRIPFWVKYRNVFLVLLALIWIIWPSYHKFAPLGYIQQDLKEESNLTEYHRIKDFGTLRRIFRSFLFNQGYAFHDQAELDKILPQLAETFLDSTQLIKIDWKNGVLNGALGSIQLNSISDSVLFGHKMKSFEVKSYKKWVKLLNDSLAYPTDYFWEGDASHRLHRGIDIAGRMDTRIHSPISGQAVIGESERAGRFVAVVNQQHIVFFAHCDKYLFLDGEDVRKGDPVATVGLTGHTSGPHVHIGTGRLDKKGAHSLGRYKFDFEDPIHWMSEINKL